MRQPGGPQELALAMPGGCSAAAVADCWPKTSSRRRVCLVPRCPEATLAPQRS